MPSFLNKVFGYKKNDDRDTARPTREASDSTLLDGKYEAIPPVVSPSVSTFTEAQPTKDSGRDVGFSFFIPKSRGASQKSARKHPEVVPHLTLQLPALKESSDSRALGVVFEADPDSQTVLDDAVIAAKRLNPLEALVLVRACAQAITERGLETLGIMHPHWFSASPDAQRKLISLFIRPLTPTSAFEDELHYTRSPHDVAAVLRWGLRHLLLENGHFGKDDTEWAWYNAFFHAERNASYPPRGFSDLLLPQLPASHIELLTATLSLVSSLASHAEVTGISGSKLSKFLGIWLLVATRVEQSDDWNRFYARWEHAGRILEHLFLARLREESFGQRLPTRLQELVKHYPYNNGSLATDGLLSRPRFSTRQYDALFVRVETVLIHSAEQPKQHPVQLLLEAFQLPIENLSGDEHVALWNTLKTTASDEVTSLDPEGPQFTRIFVDETIQLLSLIPTDNSVPTSPTLLASPIAKVVSRKRSSSLIKVLERTAPRSNTDNGSTPVSPTFPSSPVVKDWAQFSLSGFGDTPTTQPLAALLDQDDDIEVTQPRNVRKSSRQRGKSRTRRRRSEDREPLDTSPTSQSKPDLSIVETKLASVHVIQIDEAFIDFWSDAIVDPISANWPVFVVCGLKQIPGAKPPIRWLVIEQTYSHQQPQSSRVPSPDGHRGRSPRPSFRSDISGFRINSVFSSARKRLSLFSKSATDLDPKKSGGKAPVVGELGEVLVEEEPAFPSVPPIKVDHHFDGNAVIGATVTSGEASDVAGQSKADDIFAAPVAGTPPTGPVPMLQKESNPVQATVKKPLIEGAPQSEGGHNDFSVLPRSSVRRSEEAVSVEQGSSRTLDAANPEVNEADPVTNIAPLPADMSDSRSIRDTSDPAVLASRLTPTAENPVSKEVQILAEPFRQGVIVEAEDQLITQPTDGDERLLIESVDESSNVKQVNVANDSQEVSETVALSLVPESVAVVLETLSLDDEAPEHITEEPRVVKQPSRQASTESVAASTVGSVGQYEMGDLPAVQDKVGATETGAQLEPDSIISVVDAAEEASDAAEPVDTIIPAPDEFAVSVEETPCPEVSVDGNERAGVAKDHAAKPEAFDDAVPRLVAARSQPNLKAEEESTIHHVEEPFVDTRIQAVAIEAKHAADLVPELAAEEVQPLVQATTVQAVEAPVETFPIPEVETQTASISEARSVEIEDTGTSTFVPENAALVNETPNPDAAEAYKPVEVAPAVVLESEAVEGKAPEFFVEAKALPSDTIPPVEDAHPPTEIELPTQFADTEPAKALSTESIGEAAISSLATTDEIDALKVEAHPILDTLTEDVEAHTSAPRSVPIEGITMEANGPVKLAPSTTGDFEFVVDNVAEPIIKEAQVLVKDTVLPASEPIAVTPTVIVEEPVAQDVQVPTEIEEPSSELASQSDDQAVNPSVVAVSVPEEISSAKAGAPLEPEATHPVVEEIAKSAEPAPLVPEVGVSVDTETLTDVTEPELVEISVTVPVVDLEAPVPVEAKEPASDVVEVTEESVASRPEVASAVEIDETSVVDGLQEDIDTDHAEQPAGSELDVSTREPARLYEEISPAEP